MDTSDRADIVIVGGAIVGSSVATFLAMRPDWNGRIVVVERDMTYRTSSTTLSAASIRLQFSTPLNIEISRFGIGLLHRHKPENRSRAPGRAQRSVCLSASPTHASFASEVQRKSRW